jgi:hypothetical protein
VAGPTQVVHQEHHPITLDAGWYQVTRQREYVPGTLSPARSIEEAMKRLEEMHRTRLVTD